MKRGTPRAGGRGTRVPCAAAVAFVVAATWGGTASGPGSSSPRHGLASAEAASGVTVYWKRADLLRSFFKTSKRVVDVRTRVDAARRKEIEARLGYRLPRDSYVFYAGLSGTKVTGYALIDEEMGQHLPITFATRMTPDARVSRVEVVVYRESHGDEIRDARFRDQFVGKKASAPLRIGGDVVAVSGATISSHSIAIGVRRALILTEELMLKGTALAARLSASSSP